MAAEVKIGELRLGVRAAPGQAAVDPNTPFRIAVLGDFSGRGGQAGEDPALRPPPRAIQVDRDNIDQVLARIGPQCDASIGDQENHVVPLRFARLGDFHPDHLFEAVPLLARFRQLREKLLSPATFEKAAEEVRAWGLIKKQAEGETAPVPKQTAAPKTAPPPAPTSGASLLEQAIGQTDQAAPCARTTELPGDLAELVRRTIEPYRVPKSSPDQADLLACVDSAASQLMRSILHDPRFQALEAAWRGVAFLVRRLPTGPKLKISIIDLSLADLAADLTAAARLESSAIYKLLVEQTAGTPGGQPWGLLVANYSFGPTPVELLLAGCLARIAAQAGAPLVAGASPQLLGCESLAATPDLDDWQAELPEKARKAWESLRAGPEASSLGLALPRFPLRMPYGPESSPIESFGFEELPDPAEHESYLWGNAALACAFLLGRAFHEHGWRMRPEDVMTIEDLPVYTFERDGECVIQPCAETLLSDRAIERVLDAGLMPLATIKGSGTARLMGWRSVAASGAQLAGRWA